MNRKALVCITPQSNSKRLIDKGYEISGAQGNEFLILHVLKGNNIFKSQNTGSLLQELFEYGKEKGGVVHALSGENIFKIITDFAREHEVTDIILGEPPIKYISGVDIGNNIKKHLPDVNMIILKRTEEIVQIEE